MKRYLIILVISLMAFINPVKADSPLVQLTEKNGTGGDYTSIFCFRVKVHYVYPPNKRPPLKERHYRELLSLHFMQGAKLFKVPLVINETYDGAQTVADEYVYYAAIPGTYDLVGLYYTGAGGTYFYQINLQTSLEKGNAYYAGEFGMSFEQSQGSTSTIFHNITVSQQLLDDMSKLYSSAFAVYKDHFSPATFRYPSPVKPTREIFSTSFNKSENRWIENKDSLHSAYFESDKYYIQSFSGHNVGGESVEMNEKLGKSFEVQLKCTWKSGGSLVYGLCLPERRGFGYIFGISNQGYGRILYEYYPTIFSKGGKKLTGLTDWKKISPFNIGASGENTIRVQVINGLISFYVNDMLVSRAPYNSASEQSDFQDEVSKSVGVCSFGTQVVQFDELKVSKFDEN